MSTISAKAVMQKLDLLEWLVTHPGARPMDDAPGWYIQINEPIMGPFHVMHCYRAADGTRVEARRDLYLDFMNPVDRWGITFDSIARDELIRQGYAEGVLHAQQGSWSLTAD